MYLWIISAVAAFFIKGLCGFANTLIFDNILIYRYSNAQIAPVEMLTGYPTNFFIVWKERRYLKWNLILPASAMVLLGAIPGVLILKNVDTTSIRFFFGFIVILLAIEPLIREKLSISRDTPKPVLALLAVVAGLMCGVFGVGALLGAYFTRVTDDSHTFKANLSAVFAVESTVRLFMYFANGMVTPEMIHIILTLLPLMLVSLLAGMKLSGVLDDRVIKRIIMVLLVISGTSLIITNLP